MVKNQWKLCPALSLNKDCIEFRKKSVKMREKKLSDYLVSALSISFHFSSMLAAPLIEQRSAMTQLHRHRDPFQQRSNKGVDLPSLSHWDSPANLYTIMHCFPLVLAVYNAQEILKESVKNPFQQEFTSRSRVPCV